MTPSRHHLTLIDLMATVAAAALGMIPLVWDPPAPSIPVLVILFWLVVPLVGIVWARGGGGAWHRRRGPGGGGRDGLRAGLGNNRPTQARTDGTLLSREQSYCRGLHDRWLPHLRHADGSRDLARGCCDGAVHSPTVPSSNDRFVRQR
jgi:hypothetical protein